MLTVIAALHGLIGAVFALQGLWLVAPFSGLEVIAVAAGLARLRWHAVREPRRSCLQLGSHGRFFEIGAFLVETERQQLAGELGRLLGQPRGAHAPTLAVNAGLNREMGL